MLDFDAGKLLIIGIVALVVIGPKDLPRVLRQVGQMVGKLRRMAGEFQGQFMDAMKEADLQDLRAEVAKLKDSATLDVNFDPARDLRSEFTRAIDGPAATDTAVAPEASGSTAEHGGAGFKLPMAPTTALDLLPGEADPSPAALTAVAEDPVPNPAAAGIGPALAPLPLVEAAPMIEGTATQEPVRTAAFSGASSAPLNAGTLPHASPNGRDAEPPLGDEGPAEAEAVPQRRKILVSRRRPAVRIDGPASAVARSRMIRPVRHETADQ